MPGLTVVLPDLHLEDPNENINFSKGVIIQENIKCSEENM